MRYAILDLLRSLAISLVVFYHLRDEITKTFYQPFLKLGDYYSMDLGSLAVILFIIISGIVLELKYGKKQFQYLKFIFKRFKRIYPVYFVSLVLGIVIYLSIPAKILKLGIYYFPNIGNTDIFCSIFGLCNFFLRRGGPFLGSGWFIGLIVSLYFIYPFLSKRFKRSPHLTLVVLFIFTITLHVIEANTPSLSRLFIRLSPLFHVFEFGLGIYLVRVIKPAFWFCLNKYSRFRKVLGFIGLLSFPLFLIHHPLLFILNYLTLRGVRYAFSITLYLIASVLVSFIILKIVEKLSRKKV